MPVIGGPKPSLVHDLEYLLGVEVKGDHITGSILPLITQGEVLPRPQIRRVE